MTRNSLNSIFAAAAFATLAVSCNMQSSGTTASAPPDIPAITAEIQAMEDAFASAVVARDVDGILVYYGDDAVSYSREKEPALGKAALRQRLEEQMKQDTLGLTPSFKVLDVFVGEDHITEIGSWSDTDAMGAVVDHGTFFSVFKKRGDKWECIRDISVSAKPKDAVVAMQ
jgi:ketosteroid isomerase-like protein